ncbi:MAG: aminotransferase class IV [Rhodospirillales bacterium]|nr:aminotransferase class IV [Rhodospirillales bacterium]
MASLFRRGSTRNRVVAVKESPVGRVRCEMCLEATATNQNATESTTNSAWSVRVIGFFLLENHAAAASANVFFVMDGELHTPDPDCFLDGITRRTVIRLAQKQQMKVIARPIEPEEIGRASEVFLAGTAAEVTAVREIGEHRFTPGRVTESLMQSYDALVRQGDAEVRQALS